MNRMETNNLRLGIAIVIGVVLVIASLTAGITTYNMRLAHEFAAGGYCGEITNGAWMKCNAAR